MSTYIGDIFELYHAHIASMDGYTANKQIADENYAPTPNAHKNFFMEFSRKSAQVYSSNSEGISMEFRLKVIFQFPRKNDYSENEHNMWNDIDELERSLLDFSDSQNQYLFIDEIGTEQLTEDYKLATFIGKIEYTRALTYG